MVLSPYNLTFRKILGYIFLVLVFASIITLIYRWKYEALNQNINNQPEQSESNTYRNDQYGFSFDLPDSWIGYKVLYDQWQGENLDPKSNNEVIEQGPKI